ncbi:SURF1 family protein [Marinobacter changyiensis]|uniref:SURF1 family protein n=1 Tax=Marinobacter changyiensis TaxID=2604091 RepID=UPI001265348E|nr:SURF1 family protein [Marinobacter changyiensis]
MVSEKPKSVRTWHFDWRLGIFSGVFLPLLLALGAWQLDRASEKQALLEQWQQQSETLSWSNQLDKGLESGQPVELVGRYSEQFHWLLDNRTRDGVPGYEVLSVFYPEQGAPVVVNRGWVRGERQRGETPVFTTPEGLVSIRGRISPYPEPPVLADSSPESIWPRRIQTLSPEDARQIDGEMAEHLVRLDGRQQPGGFAADWAPDLMGPQTHYGYAVQWFSLALALIVLTVIASYRKTDSGTDDHHG